MERLRIEGEVQQARAFTFADLAALPDQISDISQLIPGREGGGVRLQSIVDKVHPSSAAAYITLKSSDGKFSASIPLEAVRNAVVAYRLGNEPLPAKKGGPFRFLIPNVEECAIGGVDACANVKFLGEIRFSNQPGADNRPTTKTMHEEHHTKEGHEHLK
jgi:DMSO/TMAO reductase YedYZ molybdopterin-dependent catalytic subunit